MSGPVIRPRRNRLTAGLRRLVRETQLGPGDLIAPLFVVSGNGRRDPIASMPGQARVSVDVAVEDAQKLRDLGVPGVLLFGIPDVKDALGSASYDADAPVQRAIRALKERLGDDLLVFTDVCLCEYTDHGHCGIVNGTVAEFARPQLPDGYVLNDETLSILGRVAVSHAVAGADVVAPSGMIDDMVRGLRSALDAEGYESVGILSYAVKYASAFYGPFRDAAAGAPTTGDRASHQMDAANWREALREAELDIQQGADMVMVKPALAYLDVIRAVHERFPQIPMAAYNVSGEYAMVKAAAAAGWLDERQAVLEVLTAMRRAGATTLITYHAADAARWLSAGTL